MDMQYSLYIRLVDDLTIDQIRILHYIYNNELVGHCSKGLTNNIYAAIHEKWPEIDKHYLSACFTELLRFFIVTSSTNEVAEGDKKGHTLTSFGKRFVNYIFTPNNLYD